MSDKLRDKAEETPRELRPWPLLASKVLNAFPIYTLRQDKRRSPRTGKEHDFLVLDSRDWINVVPVTPACNLVLIRQFRHGTASLVWEVPGGMVDKEDANPEQAAQRELLEETGYVPEEMVFLGAVHPNPAIQNNRCYSYLARGLSEAGSPEPDAHESFELVKVPLARIPELITSREITHALVIAAFHLLDQRNTTR